MKNDKKSLNEILDIYQNLESKIIASDGAVDDEMENLLNVNELDLKNKLDGYQGFIKYLEGQISYLKSMESHFAKRRKTLENSIKKCKDSMTRALSLTDNTKVKTSNYNFSLCKTESWSVDSSSLSNEIKDELINKGIAKNILKISLNDLKLEYKNTEKAEIPEWIKISKDNYIRVS